MGAWIETTRSSTACWPALSHPVWVRGLKLLLRELGQGRAQSHPVWVRGLKLTSVADAYESMKSHPVWVRGLKQKRYFEASRRRKVAPRVGAWIETRRPCSAAVSYASHPVWVRGLKQQRAVRGELQAVSHPVWVRGLKRQLPQAAADDGQVAPRVGAWIETPPQ